MEIAKFKQKGHARLLIKTECIIQRTGFIISHIFKIQRHSQ